MKKITDFPIIIFFVITCLLQSCQAVSPILPTQNPTATPSRKSSEVVLTACPIHDQEKAMRPAYLPDWENLGLFACYDLSLDLSAPAPYPGSETLIFTNPTPDSLADVVLRTFPNAPAIYGGGMNVGVVSVDDQLVKTEIMLEDHTALRILLNQPLPSGQTAKIQVEFTLVVPIGFTSNTTYGVFGQSSSGSVFTLANWFPILAIRKNNAWQVSNVLPGGDAVTSETALFKVAIITPPAWKIAATGVEVAAGEINGNIRHQWVSGPVRDFMLTASSNFKMQQVQTGDIQINQWGLDDTLPYWSQALDTVKTALDYYQKTFGPYPFKELDVAAVPLQYASGVEYPGIILILDKAYLPSSRQGLLQVVLAHETAHQWWYSIVGNDVLQDPWQDEGLTTYSTLAFLRAQGSPIAPALQKDYQDQVAAYERDHPSESIAQPVSAFKNRESAYSTLVYVKTALFFDQVRQRIGDAALEKALQHYFSDNQYRLVPPAALLTALGSACGCDLSDLYRKYGVGNLNP